MSSPAIEPGTMIAGRFELEKRLGSGGSAVVWSARDRKSGAKVAVKLLHEERRKVSQSLERFEREAEILKKLDHPSITKLIAAEPQGELPYLAIELATGTSLDQLIEARAAEGRPFSSRELSAILAAI